MSNPAGPGASGSHLPPQTAPAGTRRQAAALSDDEDARSVFSGGTVTLSDRGRGGMSLTDCLDKAEERMNKVLGAYREFGTILGVGYEPEPQRVAWAKAASNKIILRQCPVLKNFS